MGSPVQTQRAVAVYNGPGSGEYHGSLRGKPSLRRRVFVQTENGIVLGMDLDRSDNVHTVKRRLQLALNVPIDESSLTSGDVTLHRDLSGIRNDSALLLTRNSMHRSSSTPCLSPTGRNHQQRDRSGLVEIIGRSGMLSKTNELVKETVKAIKNNVDPVPVHGGLGGAYFFRNSRGENVAIVKPTDEEPYAPNNPKGFVGKALGQPGLKRSVRVGETGFREVAAYLLDHNHFANVPPTVLVKVTHSIFNVNDSVSGNKLQNKKKVSKIASLQQFVPHDFDASDHGTSSFPVSAVHRIGILDIRIFNTDRHAGNLLVRKPKDVGRFALVELIPIDHGLCLPESLEDPYFEWIHWPQASIPFSEDELEYIKNLDPFLDAEMLRAELPMIREACLRVLILCTIFLKEAAAFGLCLAEIGEMMSREFKSGEEDPSELEVVCLEARKRVLEKELSFSDADWEEEEEELPFHVDCDDTKYEIASKLSTGSAKKGSFTELESIEEDKFEADEGIAIGSPKNQLQGVHNLSQSLERFNFHDRSQHNRVGGVPETTRSANEQFFTSASFVKLADMKEDEWVLFLEKFKELLNPAFAKRRSATVGQAPRLGTSCRF